MLILDLKRYRTLVKNRFPEFDLSRRAMKMIVYETFVYVIESGSLSNKKPVSFEHHILTCYNKISERIKLRDLTEVLDFLDCELKYNLRPDGLVLPFPGFLDHRLREREEMVEIIPIHKGEVDYIVDRCGPQIEDTDEETETDVKNYHSIRCMDSFRDWLNELDESRVRPVPREFFSLIENFVREGGWDK